jgi:hypothetical protein
MPRYLLGQAPSGGGATDFNPLTQFLIPMAAEGAAADKNLTASFANGLKSAGLKNATGEDAAGLIRLAGSATQVLTSNEPDPIIKAQKVMQNSGAVFGLAFSFAGPVVAGAAGQFLPMLLNDITGRVACSQKGWDFCTYLDSGGKPAAEAAWDFMRSEYLRQYSYRLVKPFENGWYSEQALNALMAPVTEEELARYKLTGKVSPSGSPLTKSVIRERAVDPAFDPDKIGALTIQTEAKLRREATTYATVENIKQETALKALDISIYRDLPEFKDLLTTQKVQIYEAIRDRRKQLIRKKTFIVFGVGTGVTLLLAATAFLVGRKTWRA